MPLPDCTQILLLAIIPALAGGQTLHSFGNPSAHEQEYIEKINRARANPAAEGVRIATSTHPDVLTAISWAGVNLAQFKTEMTAIAVRPPLAPHAGLTTAARGHSQWMFNHQQQVHDQPGGQTFSQRMSAVGYSGSTGENIFAYAKAPEHGHAGFEIDWADPRDTTATFGMQSPRGHRNSIHSSSYREIGVGVVNGSNGSFGPQLVTQNFGNRSAAPYYGTGVAYYDLDGDNSYDAGEGIPGLTVNVSGASFYCLTADGGGWAVPIPSSANTRTVTFSGLGINQSASVSVPVNSNAKADLKLAYTPPLFTSAPVAKLGDNHAFQFTATPGATVYHYSSSSLSTPSAENCENLNNATTITSAGYSVVQTVVKHEGASAWRMTFISGSVSDQFIEISGTFFGSATSSMSFRSRLGQATASAYARVQVKEEGTSTWVDVYSQQGTGSSGEATFQARSVPLASMNGKLFKIRLMFDATGSVSVGTEAGVGWYIDAITFATLAQLGTAVTGSSATTSLSLPTPAGSSWLLRINPVIGGYPFPGSAQTLQVINTNSFTNWVAYHEAHGRLAAGALTASSDPDGDGRSSLLEFAFGSNPVVADTPPSGSPVLQPSSTQLIARYELNTALSGLTITPESSNGSGTWRSPGQPGAPSGFVDVLVSTSNGVQTREARIPLAAGAIHLLRLRLNLP